MLNTQSLDNIIKKKKNKTTIVQKQIQLDPTILRGVSLNYSSKLTGIFILFSPIFSFTYIKVP